MAILKLEKQDLLEKALWMVKFRYLVVLIALLLGVSGGAIVRAYPSVFAGIVLALVVFVYNFISSLYIKKNAPFFTYNVLLGITFSLFIVDLLIITLLIHFTGGILSPFVLLYLYVIIAMSIVAPGKPIFAWASALAIIIFYSGLLWLEYIGAFKPFSVITRGLNV